ncbi:hypothetical protein M5K25_025585 [Dendrobium thyrsiflorum]|uniref:Cystatin domain-containing protein n=1 Tax=Dendrobium thyrsiflorum TaxID=117978 RepID=A0ABD0U9T2_DENTH
MKSFLFLASLLLAASVSIVAGNGGGRRGLYDAGWQLIKNVKDSHVQEIAKFAVDEENKHSLTPLSLIIVNSGETKIASGVLYRLIITVGFGGPIGFPINYEATVLEKNKDDFELISFNDSGRRGLFDAGWQPIKNLSDPHVLEIAKFAVDENNKDSHTSLTLYKVDSGETTISVGALYRLIVVVGVGNVYGVLAEYEATVLEKSRGDFELISFKWRHRNPKAKMRSHLFLSVLLLAAYLSLSTSAADVAGNQRDPIVGGWQPIKNLSDPHVQKIAKFAVDEHNKNAPKPLRLISVKSGATQIVSGVNYRLIIVADLNSPYTLGKYEATVLEKSWENVLKLTSFKSLIY